MDIKAMYRAGVSISGIHRRTGRNRKTIRKIVREPEDAASSRVTERRRAGKLDPYRDYVLKRMSEGALNAVRIFEKSGPWATRVA